MAFSTRNRTQTVMVGAADNDQESASDNDGAAAFGAMVGGAKDSEGDADDENDNAATGANTGGGGSCDASVVVWLGMTAPFVAIVSASSRANGFLMMVYG
jgi:hypothetical protein